MNRENSDDDYLLTLDQKPLSEIPQYEKSTQKNAFLYSQKIITGENRSNLFLLKLTRKWKWS